MRFDPQAQGIRIRLIRKQKGLTLAEVSRRSGVAVSTLSKLENGQVTASMDTIFKVSRGLGVLFDNLVDTTVSAAPTGRWIVTRARQARRAPTALYDYSVYAAELVEKQMIPLVMHIKTRGVPRKEDWSTHRGEEFVLVLSGAIEIRTELYAPARLKAGDSVYFDSLMRHCFIAQSRETPVILSVCLSDHARLDEQLERKRSAPSGRMNGRERRAARSRRPAASP
jgi:transcriptional regulator with XRE-family HTH domain